MRLQMRTKVNKADLIERIKTALEEHKTTYAKALDGWVEQMRIASEAVVARVERGQLKAFPKQFQNLMTMPSLHVGDFEMALEMLEMSVDDEIELEPEDFNQLVLGNWSWKEAWETTNSRYLSD